MREVNARVLRKGLELVSVNGGRFEINPNCYVQRPSGWSVRVKNVVCTTCPAYNFACSLCPL